MGNGQVILGCTPRRSPADRRRGQAPALQNRVMIGAPAGAPALRALRIPAATALVFQGHAPMAARRAQPVQRSRSQGLRGNRDTCRPRRGVVGPSYGSFAFGQARKLIPSAGPLLPSRHCDSRAEVARQSRRSFFPARFIRHRRRFAGKLSPPNPLRSRWRLCRLTDAACPLRVLRWASAGAPVTASASQWGRRQCAVGLRPVRTAHRRREPPFRGAPGALPIKIQRSHLQKNGASREGAPTDKHRAATGRPYRRSKSYPGKSRQITGLAVTIPPRGRRVRDAAPYFWFWISMRRLTRSPVLWMICSRDWYRPG